MPNNRELAHLWDILQAIEQIKDFTKNITYQEYCQSNLIQSAVERQLEKIFYLLDLKISTEMSYISHTLASGFSVEKSEDS